MSCSTASSTASRLDDFLARALAAPRNLSADDLSWALTLDDAAAWARIDAAADAVKARCCGHRVALRGLVECSNVCAKNCRYCGIRGGNTHVARYRMSDEEIIACCRQAADLGYGSVALQAGEIESEANTAFYEKILTAIADLGLGVTLSLGEQAEAVYRRWRTAGAARYLLRIETANPELYAALHPADHSWTRRVDCLRVLRRLDYQTGTGVMIALPGQTAADLARDIVFYGEIDVDMIGMGPYLPHPDSPLPGSAALPPFETALRMVALTRLYLHDVNIAATTALQAMAPDGREQAIRRGANVIMPNLTPQKYRQGYRLYDGKPEEDENSHQSRLALERRLAVIGEALAFGEQGNSPHWSVRSRNKKIRGCNLQPEAGIQGASRNSQTATGTAG